MVPDTIWKITYSELVENRHRNYTAGVWAHSFDSARERFLRSQRGEKNSVEITSIEPTGIEALIK